MEWISEDIMWSHLLRISAIFRVWRFQIKEEPHIHYVDTCKEAVSLLKNQTPFILAICFGSDCLTSSKSPDQCVAMSTAHTYTSQHSSIVSTQLFERKQDFRQERKAHKKLEKARDPKTFQQFHQKKRLQRKVKKNLIHCKQCSRKGM